MSKTPIKKAFQTVNNTAIINVEIMRNIKPEYYEK